MGNYKDQDPNQAPPLNEDVLLKAIKVMEEKLKEPPPEYVWYGFMNFAAKQRLKALINGYEDDQQVTEDF